MSMPTNFPEGLRVLAIDANEVCLKLLVRLLEKCCYKVTSTTSTMEALRMLRENKDNFDIVLTDVKNLDMDGISLLDIVGVETDLPVIMISADDSSSTALKGIRHGAQDFILKPVRLQNIQNIWQHVFRKSLNQPIIPCSQKRHKRLVWTPPLHNKFVDAIELLGTKAVPKEILRVMNEPGLTRANIASHLQKFRRMLKNPTADQEGKSTRASSHKQGERLPVIADVNQQIVLKTSGKHCNTSADTTRELQSDHFSKSETFNHSDHILELSPLCQYQPLNQQNVMQQQFSPPPAPHMVDQMTHPRKSEPFNHSVHILESSPLCQYQPLNQQNVMQQQFSPPPAPRMVDEMTRPRKSEPFNHSDHILELSPLCQYQPLNQQNVMQQRQFSPPPAPHMVDQNQMRHPRMHYSMLENVPPTPLWTKNHLLTSSPFDHAYPLLGSGASTRMVKTPQLTSVYVPAQNFAIDKDLRQKLKGPPLGLQGALIHTLERDPSINSLLHPGGISETEGNFQIIPRTSSEDDLTAMVKQFGSDGDPDVNQRLCHGP